MKFKRCAPILLLISCFSIFTGILAQESQGNGFSNNNPLVILKESQVILKNPKNSLKNLPAITYPDQVEIFLSATEWTRVAEPLIPVDPALNIRFRITKDVADSFAVTKKSGIVYVKKADAFKGYLAATHRISVTWNLPKKRAAAQTKVIDVNIKKPEIFTCSNDLKDEKDSFCAKFQVQEKCEQSCGVGSPDARCKWNQATNKSFQNYTTCTPDLKTCSDGICDPLELLNYNSNGSKVCPQDCFKTEDVLKFLAKSYSSSICNRASLIFVGAAFVVGTF